MLVGHGPLWKLVEETPTLHLLDEVSAGGLRPCAPRMGSDLAPRRREGGQAQLPQHFCVPLLYCCCSWRLQSRQHLVLTPLSSRSTVDISRWDRADDFFCSHCKSSWAGKKRKVRNGSFLLLVGWDVMAVLNHPRGASEGC